MAKATADIRSLARAQTELAIRTLTGVCGSKAAPAAARVSAAQRPARPWLGQAATDAHRRGWRDHQGGHQNNHRGRAAYAVVPSSAPSALSWRRRGRRRRTRSSASPPADRRGPRQGLTSVRHSTAGASRRTGAACGGISTSIPQSVPTGECLALRHFCRRSDIRLAEATDARPTPRGGVIDHPFSPRRTSGQVWQPYVRANLWRDWGAQATTTFSGADLVPLLEQATRLQLGGGLSVRMNANVSFYANADYQFSVSESDGSRRNGVRGAAGVRYTW
jgi:hypothetical protein